MCIYILNGWMNQDEYSHMYYVIVIAWARVHYTIYNMWL